MFTNLVLALVLLFSGGNNPYPNGITDNCVEPLIIYQEYLDTEDTIALQCVTESGLSTLIKDKTLKQYAVSPTGESLAYVVFSNGSSTLYLLDLENGDTELILSDYHTIWIQWLDHDLLGVEGWDHFPRPSGTDFAQHLAVYDTQERALHDIDAPPAKLIGFLDAQKIVLANYELGLFTVDLQGLQESIPLPASIYTTELEIDISSSGQQIVYVDNQCASINTNSSRSCFVLFDPESNNALTIDKLSTFAYLAYPQISPNENYIALMSYTTDRRKISIYDIEGDDIVVVGEEGSVIGYRWLPDTDTLLIAYQEAEAIEANGIVNLYLVDPASGMMTQVTNTQTSKFLR